jgi:hypothetical protein
LGWAGGSPPILFFFALTSRRRHPSSIDKKFMPAQKRIHAAAHILTALLVFDGFTAGGLAERQSQSAVVATNPSHDFGVSKQGQPIVHAFVLQNRGEQPQVIDRVDLSQGGMKARFARRIEPGQQQTVTITWDNKSVAGEIAAEAVVRFQDSAVPPLKLTLNGVVKAPIELLPNPAVFFSVFKGETAERRIRIVNNEETPVTVKGVEAQSPHFRAEVVAVEAGRSYELIVRVPDDVAPGRYMESATVLTDSPARPRLTVGVNVLVKTDLYANPEAVDFGTINLTAATRSPRQLDLFTQPVMLRRRQGTFEIKTIESSTPAVKVVQEPAKGKSESFRLDVSLERDKLQPGPLEGSIRILTTAEDFPEIVVKVSGTVK